MFHTSVGLLMRPPGRLGSSRPLWLLTTRTEPSAARRVRPPLVPTSVPVNVPTEPKVMTERYSSLVVSTAVYGPASASATANWKVPRSPIIFAVIVTA